MQPSYSIYNYGKWKTDVQLYNTKDHPIVLKKGTTVARIVAANVVPETVMAESTVGALHTRQWAKEGHVELSVKDWRKLSLEKLKLSGLDSWTEENKEMALNLLAEYHNIFAVEDGEMGCTEATEHKIEVMDPKPFKERPQDIPTGLLDKVKKHLDHMLKVGAIKPTKSAWSNAVVLVQRKDGGLSFCIDS